jgi:hypothetical protein
MCAAVEDKPNPVVTNGLTRPRSFRDDALNSLGGCKLGTEKEFVETICKTILGVPRPAPVAKG